MNYKILAIVVFMLCGLNMHAQTAIELTPEEKEQVKSRIADKLQDFQFYLGEMADKRNSQLVRESAHKSNKGLFIGKCEPYYVTNISTGMSEERPAVTMETSSVTRAGRISKRTQPMKQYFINLMNNRTYSNIIIEQSDAVLVGKLYKVGDGKYETVAHIYQYFTGYGKGDRGNYIDITEKAVRIMVDVYENYTPDGRERIVDIKLGDMKVVLTERLN